MSTLQAPALWDFDGTLADTEPLWVAAEFDLVDSLGGQWSQAHAEQLVGNSLLDSGAYILNVIGRHDLSPAWVVDRCSPGTVDRVAKADAVAAGSVGAAAGAGEAGIRAPWSRRPTGSFSTPS